MSNTHIRSKDFGKGDRKSYFRLIPYIRLPWLLIALAFVVDLVYSDVMAYVPVSTSALFEGEFTGRALASAVLFFLSAPSPTRLRKKRTGLRPPRDCTWRRSARRRLPWHQISPPV